jgi:hypothetical protein
MPRLRIVRRILLAVAFVMASAVTSLAEPDPDELKVAKDVISKMVDGAAVNTVAGQKKKTSSEAVMALLDTPGKKGGLGYGPKGTTSIEARLQDISKKGITDAALAKEVDDLTKAVQIAKAVNEFNDLYRPTEKKGGKDPKVWIKSNDDAKQAFGDLLDALKNKDAKKVTAAAKALDLACTTCHKEFKVK